MYIKSLELAKWALVAVLALALGWMSLRCVLPWLAPFIVAFLLARLLEPIVKLLCRHGWSREVASGTCTLALVALIVLTLGMVITRGAAEIQGLSRELPSMLSSVAAFVTKTRQRTGDYLTAFPPEVGLWADEAIASLTALSSTLPAQFSERILAFLSAAASAAPSILLFTVTCGIGIYFISAAYPGIQAFFDTHLSEKWQRRRLKLNVNIRFTFGKYVRAQLILMVITFVELLITFLLLRIEGAAILSFIIAVLDALPVLGAGAVLLPWAVISLLTGESATGFGLLIAWGIITLMRNCLQAKLLGDQLGLHPLVTLIAIYIGWCAMGVLGMVIFPIAALAGKQLYDSGVLRVWGQELEKIRGARG